MAHVLGPKSIQNTAYACICSELLTPKLFLASRRLSFPPSPRFEFRGQKSVQARLAKNKKDFWPAFVTRLLTPRSRKSGYGLLLGYRSPLDAGREKKSLFSYFSSSKTVKSSSDGRARHHNRSGVVDLVGREPLIIARVENGVTKFSPHRQ